MILSLCALSFLVKGQEEATPKTDPAKSWGIGVITGDFWNYYYGFNAFYQKSKNQFNFNLFTDFHSFNVDFGYMYYPNDWKKRADLRLMINATPYYSKQEYSTLKGAGLFVGPGIRIRCLKHFYITGSLQMGEWLYHSSRILNTGKHYFMYATFRGELGISINLNSFR